jgi:DnaJ-domain-containing protein 1
MDATTSRSVCRIILGLCFADGELAPAEERFFERLLARFSLSRAEVAPIADQAEALAELRRLPEPTRHETLALLVDAAAADGVLHPAERILIGAVAEELGIAEEEVDERLMTVLSSPVA